MEYEGVFENPEREKRKEEKKALWPCLFATNSGKKTGKENIETTPWLSR